MPAFAVDVVDRHHVIGVVAAESGIGQDLSPYLVTRRIRVAIDGELEVVSHEAIVYPLATGFLAG